MNVLKRPRGKAQPDCGLTQLSIKSTLITIDSNLHKKLQFDPSRWVMKSWIFINISSYYGYLYETTFKIIRSDIKRSFFPLTKVKIVPPYPSARCRSAGSARTCTTGGARRRRKTRRGSHVLNRPSRGDSTTRKSQHIGNHPLYITVTFELIVQYKNTVGCRMSFKKFNVCQSFSL